MTSEQRHKIIRALEKAVRVLYTENDPEQQFLFLASTPEGFECDTIDGSIHEAEVWLEGDGEQEWHPDIDTVSWGIFIPVEGAEQFDREETPDGEHDYTCDYRLVPTVKDH